MIVFAVSYIASTTLPDKLWFESNVIFTILTFHAANIQRNIETTKLLEGKKAVFLPNLTHSYILELKYMPKEDYTEEAAEKQWQEAVEQINSYAVAPRVEALRQGTQMHKIDHHSNGVIYRGK